MAGTDRITVKQEELLEAVRSATSKKSDDGLMTMEQIAESLALGLDAARQRVKAALKSGKMYHSTTYRTSINGIEGPRPGYGLTESETNTKAANPESVS